MLLRVRKGVSRKRTKLDELQAKLYRLKLRIQASHIQYLFDHGPGSDDEMGYEPEEDSDIMDVDSTSNSPLGEDSDKEVKSVSFRIVILSLLQIVHHYFHLL